MSTAPHLKPATPTTSFLKTLVLYGDDKLWDMYKATTGDRFMMNYATLIREELARRGWL